MSISTKVKQLLTISGKKKNELQKALGLARPQAMTNKFYKNVWSAADLLTAAELTGSRVVIIAKDGQQIELTKEDARKPEQ